MDEPVVGAVEEAAQETQLPAGAGEPQPTRTEDELRKLQAAKDREIAARDRDNAELRARLEKIEADQAQARIQAIEDPEERAAEWVKAERARLDAERQRLHAEKEQMSYPIVLAMLSQQHGVPPEVLAPARSAQEMENLALKWKLEHVGKELESAKKTAPAAAGQKFNQGAGQAPSAYDSGKYAGTGDVAGSLRAKRQAGL